MMRYSFVFRFKPWLTTLAVVMSVFLGSTHLCVADKALFNKVIVVRSTVQEAPPRISLNWSKVPGSGGFRVFRKHPHASSLGLPITTIKNADATSFVDRSVLVGAPYEYRIQTLKQRSGFRKQKSLAHGFVSSGIAIPPVDSRGTVLLLIDHTVSAHLTGELKRFEQDLIGDGWSVVKREVTRQSTVNSNASPKEVEAVKKVIREVYAQAWNLNMVILFGRVPLPYSGWLNPDGHGGQAREADTYYAVPAETWSDKKDYGGKGLRGNRPGDGKFDQSWVNPQNVLFGVGRIDMSGLPIFGVSEIELLRRYLNKDHAFRHRHVVFPTAGNAGYGLVGSQTGFHLQTLFAPGQTNASRGQLKGDFMVPRLWSYAEGLAYVNNNLGEFYSSQKPQYVFTGCWGSGAINYDDTSGKQGMGRAVLASSGASLTWVCGQPNRYYHWMAMGETIGGCERLAMRHGPLYPTGCNGNYYPAVFRGLLGDPTLRLHIVAPPSSVSLAGTKISWEDSPDNNTEGFQGYHIYRAAKAKGPYKRLTKAPVTGASWTDPNPIAKASYQVRAVRLETSSSGTYTNTSQGIFVTQGRSTIITNTQWLTVPEAGTSSFKVKLSAPPREELRLSVVRIQGDQTITIDTTQPLVYTSKNWNVWQTLTLSAKRDDDFHDGSALLELSAPGFNPISVSVEKEDAAILVSSGSFHIKENDKASLRIRLSSQPESTLKVVAKRGHTYRTGENITIQSGQALTFTPSNWRNWQEVTFFYRDADEIPRSHDLNSIFAIFSFSAPGHRSAKTMAKGIERHMSLSGTAAPADTGKITPDRGTLVVPGEPVAIKAEPAPGMRFAGWRVRGKNTGIVIADPSSPETTITAFAKVNKKRSGRFIADFVAVKQDSKEALISTERDKFLIEIPEDGTAEVRVRLTSRPSTEIQVQPSYDARAWDKDFSISSNKPLHFTPENWNHWQTVTLTAKADSDRSAGIGQLNFKGKGIVSAHVYVLEKESEFKLTALPGAGGASVSPAGRTTVKQNKPVSLRAQAAPGYRFSQWMILKGEAKIDKPMQANTTVILNSAAEVRAVFVRNEHRLDNESTLSKTPPLRIEK